MWFLLPFLPLALGVTGIYLAKRQERSIRLEMATLLAAKQAVLHEDPAKSADAPVKSGRKSQVGSNAEREQARAA